MNRIRVTHRTTYRYARPVRLLQHRLMVRPQDSHDLRLLEATLDIAPAPESTRWAHDVFGNSICLLNWDEDARTERLDITSTLALQHFPGGSGLPAATLDPGAELYPFSYASDEAADVARLRERHLPDEARVVDAWARRFLGDKGESRTLDMLAAMTRTIHDEFKYEAREEEGTNPATVTLATGVGTCRDFALLMMEAARALGFAARFVTGYLYEEDDVETHGGGATHAWCSIYLPGAGWVEYDPTNGLIAGANLIRVAVTRTPEQAIPVGGGFVGGERDSLGLEVDVSVEPDQSKRAEC
ncbi:transglutaminase family protein [Plastoroseomonas arctica]|uniref:Transglutaminase family protein n=1 Tax=Plastoroseomonas arctica TaxID=1509237 RepID=A0AAF1JVE4_9PROT|nr:transglutaminase family protein [Plastoroseomonas arctica]